MLQRGNYLNVGVAGGYVMKLKKPMTARRRRNTLPSKPTAKTAAETKKPLRKAMNLRFNSENIAILEEAAVVNGMTRSEFIRSAALREAQRTLLERQSLRLSREAARTFIEALEAPAQPNPGLVDLFRRVKK
jgi:uncharacterized protein (DUF1778 family)